MDNRSERGEDGADQRRSAALIGLIIILALAIAGVVLVRELRERSRIEDCLMAGRILAHLLLTEAIKSPIELE